MITLYTPRLELNAFTAKEMNALFNNCSKHEIMFRLGFTEDKQYEKELKKYHDNYEIGKRPFISFQLTEKTTGIIIGYCGFHNWVKEHFRAEVGYHLLANEYKNKGFMHEALLAVINYGFTEMNLLRIEACTATDNTPSIKLLDKCGFEKEGVMRKHYFMDGIMYDSLLFSLLSKVE